MVSGGGAAVAVKNGLKMTPKNNSKTVLENGAGWNPCPGDEQRAFRKLYENGNTCWLVLMGVQDNQGPRDENSMILKTCKALKTFLLRHAKP